GHRGTDAGSELPREERSRQSVVLATSADRMQRFVHSSRVTVAAHMHQVGGYQLLLAPCVGDCGHGFVHALGMGGVEPAIGLSEKCCGYRMSAAASCGNCAQRL